MKKFFGSLVVSLILVSTSAQAAKVDYIQCQNKDRSDLAVFVTFESGKTKTYAGLLNRGEDLGQIPADNCFSGKKLPKEIKANLADLASVEAVCYYITSDDGSGDLAVLRRTSEGRPQMELKTFVLDMPTLEKGQVFSCY